ncbi:TPA: hypothetical protein ACJQI7_000768 [Streptococcus pyogenes]|uniref:hypothetical protein n=1 Tax=Streptococcus pyogenes TaxID=1314 RepID=UPI0004BE3FE9|nr:hypothetical protein [Streptococcus pyogenes]
MTKQHRETLIWYRASHQERERLKNANLKIVSKAFLNMSKRLAITVSEHLSIQENSSERGKLYLTA